MLIKHRQISAVLNISILILAILFLQTVNAQTVNAQTVKLKFIETSDVHGALYPYDFINDTAAKTSLAQVYTYVKQQRDKKDQEVVLLDNGDILQGQPIVYYYNFEKTNVPHIVSKIMNYMQYDAGAVGNHDIEPGHAVYDRINKEFKFPWLAANAVNIKTDKPYFKPYTIIKRKGVKIAVLGLITPAIPYWLPEKIWEGIRFDDMVEAAEKWIKIIKEKEKPDLVVGLFHSGVDYNSNGQNADTPKNENASKLVAERVPGFDIIFVGHDHHGWNFTVKNPGGKLVNILGTINNAKTAAVANVILNYDKSKNEWNKQIAGKIIEVKNYKPDKDYMKKFAPEMKEVIKFVSKPIGRFTKTISTRESFFGDSPFIDLIQRIQLNITKADVSFASPLSPNAEIKKGTIYVRDMFKLYKYENLLYTMEMTGREIKNYLEFSYGQWFNQMRNPDDHLLNFKKDKNGNILFERGTPVMKAHSYNYSSAAGINYTVDVSKPAGERITIASMSNGKPFFLDKKYKAAINSYRGNGGGGHLTEGAKIPQNELARRVINSTEKDLRFFLMKWIEKQKIVTPAALNNWTVIPKEWWEKGKEKDYKLIFGNHLE